MFTLKFNLRLFLFSALLVFGGSTAFALSQLQVESGSVGDKYIVLTVDDSIQAPNLSNLQVEGYTVENAVFVEDQDPAPTVFGANYYNLNLAKSGKVVDFIPSLGLLTLNLPESVSPQIGTLFSDTSFNGILRKVISIESQSAVGLANKRWVFKTVQADLPEAVQDCDLSFNTRVDLTQSLPDYFKEKEMVPDGFDSLNNADRLAINLKSSQILFQPTVTGRLRIHGGKVEIFQFVVTGNCEVSAKLAGSMSGAGPLHFEQELGAKMPFVIPLGEGLFVKMQCRPFLKIEANAKENGFSAQGGYRIQNYLKGELSYANGQWRPLAENKMTISEKLFGDIQGEGEMKISLSPRVEMLFQGVQGPQLIFEPFARFSSTVDSGVTKTSLDSTNAIANKQLSLGSDIYMDMRSNFFGPADIRHFLLFNFEQKILSPPREGTLSLKEMDSSRVQLICQTYPKANYYIVQQKVNGDDWVTLPEKMVQPKIKMSTLKPNSLYRFRVMGVNEFGMGPAFPLDGMAFNTAYANHAPFIPQLQLPDSAAINIDSNVTLVWKGGDPDANTNANAKITYAVFLDAQNPPLNVQASGLLDTSLKVSGLILGHTYYWKVIAFDGIDRSESVIHSFTLKPKPIVKPEATVEQNNPISLGAYVFVPKGSFRRDDGKVVLVGPFLLGKTEVTQIEFQKKMGSNPSYRYLDSLPVERVTWEEAKNYCEEAGARLPTEAEWEFAARAGSRENFYWGKDKADEYAWYRDNSNSRTQKVGLKKPNALGLHDMAGNVFEWVQDWYGDYSETDLDHPHGPATGSAKVIRGASWYSEAENLNLSSRYSNRPSFRNFKVGFRCAKEAENIIVGSVETPPRP